MYIPHMGQADIVIKAYFFEYGKQSPKYSEFPGIVTSETMFGGKSSWANYTSRKESIKNSMNDNDELGSFIGYTGREGATENSAKQYYTKTDSKKLYSSEERHEWSEQAKQFFCKEGNIAWTLVVSLQDTSLLKKYGLRDQDDFSDIATECMNKVFIKMHLDPENMLWWEDYHTNKKNPHMHITFMEKEQTRFRGKFKPKELEMIKQVFTSNLIRRRESVEEVAFVSEEIMKDIHSTKREIVREAGHLSYGTLEDVLNLYTQLPLKGRLQYGSSNMVPFRNQLDKIVDEILDTDGIREQYQLFLGKLDILETNMNQMNNADIASIKQSEDDKLRVQLANSVLNNFKNMDSRSAEQLRAWRQDHLTDVINQVKGNTGKGDLLFDQAIDLMEGRPSASNRAKALGLMELSAKNGNEHAKHVMNYMKKSYGMNRQAYRVLSGPFSQNVTKDVRRAITEKNFAIQQEINAYLDQDDELVAQRIKDQAIDKYLKGGRS